MATTLGTRNRRDFDRVYAEALDLAGRLGPDMFRVWTMGPLIIYAGHLDAVAAMDAWVHAQMRKANENAEPLKGPAWSPSPNVD
mgnify:CR=1 FL=1